MSQPKHLTALKLRVPPRKRLDADMRKYFDKCDEKLGFVPNVLKAYSFDQVKLRAFVNMYNDLMLGDSRLSKLEREMIAVVVSSHNKCFYCLTAHGQAVRFLSGDPKLGELLVMNYRTARLSRPHRRARPGRRSGSRQAAEGGFQRSRHLGHRRGRRLLQYDQPFRHGDRHDAERGVPRARALGHSCRRGDTHAPVAPGRSNDGARSPDA
jgi:AhpD family alkylhydroperoxidase